MSLSTELYKNFLKDPVIDGVIDGIAGLISAPLITLMAEKVVGVAFAVTPLQAFVFCGSYRFAVKIADYLIQKKIFPLLKDSDDIKIDQKIQKNNKMVLRTLTYSFNLSLTAIILFVTRALAPSLSISFTASQVIFTASSAIVGAGVLAARKLNLVY